MWVFCLHIFLYITCVPDAHVNQKKAQGPLDLELQTVVSDNVGAENRT